MSSTTLASYSWAAESKSWEAEDGWHGTYKQFIVEILSDSTVKFREVAHRTNSIPFDIPDDFETEIRTITGKWKQEEGGGNTVRIELPKPSPNATAPAPFTVPSAGWPADLQPAEKYFGSAFQ